MKTKESGKGSHLINLWSFLQGYSPPGCVLLIFSLDIVSGD
jgi:hypothetical protein